VSLYSVILKTYCRFMISESPLPKHPDLFGSFPSAAAGEKYIISSVD